MAVLDYYRVTQGTAIVWGEAGASGVTATLSVDGLANGSARQGASVDLGANWARRYAVYLEVETGTAPTAGTRSMPICFAVATIPIGQPKPLARMEATRSGHPTQTCGKLGRRWCR